MIHVRLILSVTLALGLGPALAFAQKNGDFVSAGAEYDASAHEMADSVSAGAGQVVLPGEEFRWRQMIAPTVLFAGGVTGVYSQWYKDKINAPVRAYAQDEGASLAGGVEFARLLAADDAQGVGRNGRQQLRDAFFLDGSVRFPCGIPAAEQERQGQKQGESRFFAHNLQIY